MDPTPPPPSDWPAPAPELERAYRRLLLAYPSSFRRRHGAAIVTTLLEMAEPGMTRPAPADAWHLISSGARQRFRLPAGRPLAWVVAVLALLVGGAFGAAAGSWAAQQTFTSLPGPAAARGLEQSVVPGGVEHFSNRHEDATHFATLHFGSIGVAFWDVEAARQRLVTGGWAVEADQPVRAAVVRTDPVTGADTTSAVTGHVFSAERDGLVLRVQGWATGGRGSVSLMLWQQDNGSLLVLSPAGSIAGMMLGWLLTAAAFRRLRDRPPIVRASLAARVVVGAAMGRPLTRIPPGHRAAPQPVLTAALAGLTVVVLALPTAALYANLTGIFGGGGDLVGVITVHSALNPGQYWPFGPPWLNAALAAAGAILTLVTLASLWRKREPVAVINHAAADRAAVPRASVN